MRSRGNHCARGRRHFPPLLSSLFTLSFWSRRDEMVKMFFNRSSFPSPFCFARILHSTPSHQHVFPPTSFPASRNRRPGQQTQTTDSLLSPGNKEIRRTQTGDSCFCALHFDSTSLLNFRCVRKAHDYHLLPRFK